MLFPQRLRPRFNWGETARLKPHPFKELFCERDSSVCVEDSDGYVSSRSDTSLVFDEEVKGFNQGGHRGSRGSQRILNVDLFDALHLGCTKGKGAQDPCYGYAGRTEH